MLKKFDYASNPDIAGDLNVDTLHLSKTGVNNYLNIVSQFYLESTINAITREERLKRLYYKVLHRPHS